jgi:hypothetical protein
LIDIGLLWRRQRLTHRLLPDFGTDRLQGISRPEPNSRDTARVLQVDDFEVTLQPGAFQEGWR